MYIREIAKEEAVFVFKILDIKDSFLYRDLGVSMKDPAPIVGRNGQRLIARLCTESNRQPFPTDRTKVLSGHMPRRRL